MSFPGGGCGCFRQVPPVPPAPQCVECVSYDIFAVDGSSTDELPLLTLTIPAGTMKDGETFILDYCLQFHIGGTRLFPSTQFAPAVNVNGTSLSLTNFFYGANDTLQLFRLILRRIDTHLAIYDGDRDANRTTINAPDVLPWNSIWQAVVAHNNDGPQDYQSVSGAQAIDPDFTNDIIVSVTVTPNGGDVADTVTTLSPAGYKYRVP